MEGACESTLTSRAVSSLMRPASAAASSTISQAFWLGSATSGNSCTHMGTARQQCVGHISMMQSQPVFLVATDLPAARYEVQGCLSILFYNLSTLRCSGHFLCMLALSRQCGWGLSIAMSDH